MTVQQTVGRRYCQSGFTLIELMVAMTVGMILMTVLTVLLLDALRMADVMMGQAQLRLRPDCPKQIF